MQYHSGEMVAFKNRNADFLVTKDHDMVVKKRGRNYFEKIKAEDDMNWGRSFLLKYAPEYKVDDVENFYFNENDFDLSNAKSKFIDKIPMDLWLEFMGYYLSEGSCDKNTRIRNVKGKNYEVSNYRITVAQSKEKNPETWRKIKKVLDRLPFKFSYSGHQFTASNKQIFQYLKRFGLAHEKTIDRELLSCSKRQLKILLEALIDGDGSRQKTKQGKDSVEYYSCSYDLMSGIQEILLKLGMWGNIRVNRKNDKNDKKRTVYSMNITDPQARDKKGTRYSNPSTELYNGMVYCVTVPSGRIFVRRNGKVALCGNCYDEGKRCAEALFFDYYRQYDTDIKVIRIFNTYGPNMNPDDGRVVSNFIMQALRGENITVYGNGGQTRSFCYVSDLIDGMVKMMNSVNFTGPVNLGNPYEFTILQLAEMIIELTNSSSRIIYEPLPQDDPMQRQPVIDLAYEKLGWQPNVQLREGLISTIAYFTQYV